MLRIIISLFVALTVVVGATAQVVTTSPAVVTTESSPIIITFHADQGSKGLANLGSSEAIYAHTGVTTSTSTSSSDWQHAPAWLDNSPKYRLTYVSPNTWSLTIPSIKEYYGLSDEELAAVTNLMFVFRNATGSREGKTASGGDIAVAVKPAGFYVSISMSPDSRVVASNQPITLTARSSEDADVTLEANGKTATGKGVATLTTAFTSSGSYIATAKASLAGQEAADTISILRLGATTQLPYPADKVEQGAVLSPDRTSATFALAAPGKSSVLLVGSWNDFALVPEQQLNLATETLTLPDNLAYVKNAETLRQPYFWTTVTGLEPDKEYIYYYLVDGSTAIADPYARLILDPTADRFIPADVFPDMPAYPTGKVPDNTILTLFSTSSPDEAPSQLRDRPDLSSLIIYELLIRDFTGDDNNTGTIAGVIEKLDYIADLGVNAVELMPVMEFGGNDSWGYNPLFYFAPDKAYGTPADYRRLVNEIHARGMAVILDVVFNHADSRNPRQLMYSAAENPFFNATPPHAYNAFHDWNQDNPLVFSQWVDALRYWVEEYGVDGFRFDLVKGMGNNGSYGIKWDEATNSFAAPTEASTNRYNATRVERIGRLKEALAEIAPDTYFICEDLATAEEDKGLADIGATDWANINYGSCQWAMGWSDGADLSRFYAPLDGGRPYGSTISYAESHDEERAAYKQKQWGVAAIKASEELQLRRLGSIAAFMIMSPGSHMIWQFEELGDAQPVKKSDGDNNTERRKSCWNLLDNPLNSSLRSTYSSLISLRNSNPELFTSDATVTIAATPAQWSNGYTLSLTAAEGKSIALLANPLPDRDLVVKSPLGNTCREVLLSSSGIVTPTVGDSGSVTLAPGAFVILGSSGITGIESLGADTVVAPASIYTITGMRVDSSSPLPAGVYITVDPEGKARKILIH